MLQLRGALFLILFFLLPTFVLADEPVTDAKTSALVGPHQGKIEEAGPFRLELLLEKDGHLKIYLLDATLKNEIVKNSEVGVFVKSGNTESEMTCQAVEATHFECKQSGKKFKKGEFMISAKRDAIRAEEIKVKFPFGK